MIKQYDLINGCSPQSVDSRTSCGLGLYDDIVDRSQFQPDSENVRLGLNGSGSNNIGSYDGDNIPSDDVVRARSGKLDKAEVAKLIKTKIKTAKTMADTKAKEKTLNDAKALSDARQSYLDKMTGFEGVSNSPVEASAN